MLAYNETSIQKHETKDRFTKNEDCNTIESETITNNVAEEERVQGEESNNEDKNIGSKHKKNETTTKKKARNK